MLEAVSGVGIVLVAEAAASCEGSGAVLAAAAAAAAAAGPLPGRPQRCTIQAAAAEEECRSRTCRPPWGGTAAAAAAIQDAALQVAAMPAGCLRAGVAAAERLRLLLLLLLLECLFVRLLPGRSVLLLLVEALQQQMAGLQAGKVADLLVCWSLQLGKS